MMPDCKLIRGLEPVPALLRALIEDAFLSYFAITLPELYVTMCSNR